MSRRLSCLLLTLPILLLSASLARAQARRPPVPTTGTTGTAVLADTSYWRMFHTLKPPVVDAGGGQLVPYLRNVTWLDAPTPEPPANWQTPEFDDSAWLHTMARGGCQTPYLARQCVRGKFQVTSPAQVRGLTLSVDYHGGAIVYLNGKEIARRNLPAGAVTDKTLADPYPLEVYVTASGDLIADDGTYTGPGRRANPADAESRRRMALRVRSLKDFPIPSAALRQGVNVLAIELVRAPYHKIMLETPAQAGGRNRHNKYDWYTCELVSVRLAAASPDGLVPNAARPPGFQVWNSDPLSGDSPLDYGDLAEPLRPIRLVAARNGSYHGKVVVGSTKPIVGLRAAAGPLTGPGGTIPASALHVAYGYPWGQEDGFSRGDATIRSPYPAWGGLFGAVIDNAPSPIDVEKTEPPLVPGAVTPVWLAARAPKDAKPGLYQGELRLAAEGQSPLAVPIQLELTDLVLPDPQDFRTWVELIQAPDTTSVEYNLPLWSPQHFALVARSFDLLRDTGSRVLYIPAIAHTNLGNAESMIRWVKTADGRYEWDFSVMDKYLDLAEQRLGKPKVVVLQVWEIYMSSKESIGVRFAPELDDRRKASGGRPLVTLLDRATGRTANEPGPGLDDPASKPVWQALLAEVRRRLRDRQLDKALLLGMFTDATPPKAHFQFFHDIAPDLPWVHEGHGRWLTKPYDIAEVGYQSTVWGGFRFADGLVQSNQDRPPIVASLYGWKLTRLDAVFERNLDLDSYPATRWRFFPETGITGELRGIGRIGADYWRVMKDREGRRRAYIHDRFAEGGWAGNWINLNMCNSILAPGPDGPAATNRLLALVEGVQDCEARIVIERSLTDDALKARLGRDLADRCQKILDQRLHAMWRTLSNYQLGGPFFFGAGAWRWTAGIPGHRWYLSSGWMDDNKKLYDLAAHVQKKTAG